MADYHGGRMNGIAHSHIECKLIATLDAARAAPQEKVNLDAAWESGYWEGAARAAPQADAGTLRDLIDQVILTHGLGEQRRRWKDRCVTCGTPHPCSARQLADAALAAPQADAAGFTLLEDVAVQPDDGPRDGLNKGTRVYLAPQADAGTLREAAQYFYDHWYEPAGNRDARKRDHRPEDGCKQRLLAALAASSPATAGLDVERLRDLALRMRGVIGSKNKAAILDHLDELEEAALAASSPATAGLDVAWAQAEAALPKSGWVNGGRWEVPTGEGWSITVEFVTAGDGYFEPHEEAFQAKATMLPNKRIDGGYAATVVDALTSLTERLLALRAETP